MNFDSLRVSDLRDIARDNNLKNWSRLNKADLIKFLVDNLRRTPPASPIRPGIPPIPPRPGTPPILPRPGTPPILQRPPSPRPRSGRGRFGLDHLTKKDCDRNLKKDVVAAAQDYGIRITNDRGKPKTIRELCMEIAIAHAQARRPPTPPGTPPLS